jgi:hypothetical protein
MDWREYISFEEGLAYILSVLTIVLPLNVYLDHPGVFGEFATLKLLGIAALGSAVSFVLYCGTGQRLLAVVPGLVAGLGAAGLFLAFLEFRQPAEDVARRLGFYAAVGVGAAPGFLLMWVLRRIVYRRNKQ